MLLNEKKIAIIGLGYVGLPLAIEFAKKYKVLGFDLNKSRIQELAKGEDITNEANLEDLSSLAKLAKENSQFGLFGIKRFRRRRS